MDLRYCPRDRGETAQTFTMLLAGIAAVSLLVGKVGILSFMLGSVTERPRETGVRNALGATRGNIQFQFHAKAIIRCIAGGILGIAAGIGVVFGFWPARRASGLDPSAVLRYG